MLARSRVTLPALYIQDDTGSVRRLACSQLSDLLLCDLYVLAGAIVEVEVPLERLQAFSALFAAHSEVTIRRAFS